MGWDTYLTAGADVVASWRKQSVSTPAVLFRHGDLVLGDDAEGNQGVTWRTTSEQALANLANLGFTWRLLLDDYSTSRPWIGSALACLHGGMIARAEFHPGSGDPEVRFAALCETPPERELASLGELLVADVRQEATIYSGPAAIYLPPRPDSVQELLFDDDCLGVSPMHVSELAERSGRPEIARALEYVLFSRQDAPLVAWVFSAMILLHALPSDTEVVLDLSEGYQEYAGEAADPRAYADDYWRGASETISRSASFYGRVLTQLAFGTNEVATPLRYGRIEALLGASQAVDLAAQAKGRILEELVGELVELSSQGFTILEKRLRHQDEELDLVLRNDLGDPFWLALRSPLVLVECKNWMSRVGVEELRVLESKMDDRKHLCRIGVFVSLNGFTQPFLDRVRSLQGKGMTVFPLDRADIEEILATRTTLDVWFRDQGIRRVL